MEILALIKRLLEDQWNCSITTSLEKSIGEKLSVSIGKDAQDRTRTIEIAAFDQPFPLAQESYYRIQFVIYLPYQVEALALNQTASLILFLNQLMHYPGLELNELNNQLLYRYVWLTKKSNIEKPLILGIISLIVMVLNIYSGMIEEVAKGRLTFDEILQKIISNNEESLNF